MLVKRSGFISITLSRDADLLAHRFQPHACPAGFRRLLS